jgi:hypothetical protein
MMRLTDDAIPWQCEEGSHEEVAPLAEGGNHGRHGLAAAVAQLQRRQRRVLRYAARACTAWSSPISASKTVSAQHIDVTSAPGLESMS